MRLNRAVRGPARRPRATPITFPGGARSDPASVQHSVLAILLLAAALGLGPGIAAADPVAAPAVGLHERLDLGPRHLDVALDVASPTSGVAAVSGEARMETELAFGAELLVRQPYTVSLDGERALGGSRIEARRAMQLGAATVATLDVIAEPLARGLAPRAQTRLEHRFTEDSRAELAVGLGASDARLAARAHAVSGSLRFEHRF